MSFLAFVIVYIKSLTMLKALLATCLCGVCLAELRQVFANIRHGARHEASSFLGTAPEDEWAGELSPIGYRQMQTLGKILREEYVEHFQFLKPHYDSR